MVDFNDPQFYALKQIIATSEQNFIKDELNI